MGETPKAPKHRGVTNGYCSSFMQGLDGNQVQTDPYGPYGYGGMATGQEGATLRMGGGPPQTQMVAAPYGTWTGGDMQQQQQTAGGASGWEAEEGAEEGSKKKKKKKKKAKAEEEV